MDPQVSNPSPAPSDGAPGRADGHPWLRWLLILGLSLLGLIAWIAWLVSRVPGEVVEAGAQVTEQLQDLAAAFSQGTVTHHFLSHSTELSGSTLLQVARLDQTEVFVLEDAASTLWGAVELPTVTVRATAPVSFTYVLDLDSRWELELRDGRVRVLAPNLRWNRPAVDVSRLQYEVLQGSPIRDEEKALATLTQEITGRTAIRAKENIDLVRETARRQTEGFVETWLLQSFPDAEAYPVEVHFADEVAQEWHGADRPKRGIIQEP